MKEHRTKQTYKVDCKCPMCEKLYTTKLSYEWFGRGLQRKYCDTCQLIVDRGSGVKVGYQNKIKYEKYED